jgi:hypothetical protein
MGCPPAALQLPSSCPPAALQLPPSYPSSCPPAAAGYGEVHGRTAHRVLLMAVTGCACGLRCMALPFRGWPGHHCLSASSRGHPYHAADNLLPDMQLKAALCAHNGHHTSDLLPPTANPPSLPPSGPFRCIPRGVSDRPLSMTLTQLQLLASEAGVDAELVRCLPLLLPLSPEGNPGSSVVHT